MNAVCIAAVSASSFAFVFAGVAAYRRGQRISVLEAALEEARETQRNHDSLLTERSQLDTIKDEFISTVSHELRTPLTSIRGSLGLLNAGLLGNVDAKAQNLLRIAVTNTDRLIRLINDILDLERMQSGRAPLHIRRCSLRELAQQSIDTMTAMADSGQVRLELLLGAPTESVFFDGDSDRILQVLTNLLSNAVKFSPPGSTVQIRIEADTDSLLLRVSDQGRGIPPDKLDSIFDRFQQVEASDSRQKGGTGAGPRDLPHHRAPAQWDDLGGVQCAPESRAGSFADGVAAARQPVAGSDQAALAADSDGAGRTDGDSLRR